MKDLYLLDDSIISPLGFSTQENLTSLIKGFSGLESHPNSLFSKGYFNAGIIERELLWSNFQKIGNPVNFTKLEQMMLLAVHRVIAANPSIDVQQSALILSTTKGNIDLLEANENFPGNRVYLAELAKVIKDFFGFKNEPIVVSNACISGGLALAVAKRLINAGSFEQAVVVGGDLVSNFVISGFKSFLALSETSCAPFSKNREGISLGEAAAAILVSSKKSEQSTSISIIGEAIANDANHISGPSRCGEGLVISIKKALEKAGIAGKELSYISAHGTGTIYNDEMEAKALHRLNLSKVPLNSYKGYYGHTLGTSALLESILTKHSLLENQLYTSLNFSHPSEKIQLNIITENKKEQLNYALKIASGFGGCNLALIFKKEEADGK